MDPLTITTSIITLVDATAKVYQFLQSVRYADTHYATLRNELSTLTGLLRSISGIFQDCRRHHFALAAIDKTVWDQSRIAITDCQQTIDDLGALVARIGGVARSNSIFRKAKMTTQMHMHSGEAIAFRDKIHVSTVSLQTLLQIITVSLSLRSNASHDTTLRELTRLKQDLEISGRTARDFESYSINRSDRHLSRNLEGLVRAARDFHSNASNTASTILGDATSHGSVDFHRDQAYTDLTSVPRTTSAKRRHIKAFLNRQSPPSRSSSYMGSAIPSNAQKLASSDLELYADIVGVKVDVDVDNVLSEGLKKTAQKAIRNGNFQKAEDILKQALSRYKMDGPEDAHHSRLRTQLALCSILEGKRTGDLEDSIIDLADYRGTARIVADQLLYALALSYMHTLDFDKAERVCSLIDSNSTKSSGHKCPGKLEVFQLFFVSYRLSGKDLLADAIVEQLPELYFPGILPSVIDFMSECPELLTDSGITMRYYHPLVWSYG
ncbi:hypothetical protein PG997_010566 [Apiospora hydei]|uniref:Fungal N-terminal domain-containing protein n=1 Tax=Apiospora hydei TaxID=1337664 RepID=A0ABR1VGI8_9PEZI